MLVLSRKHGEEIVIADDVVITVLAVQGNRVKLGITAPRDVVIRRAELDDEMELPACAFTEVHDTSPRMEMAIANRH